LPDSIIEKLADYLRDFSLNDKAVKQFRKSISELKSEFDNLGEETIISDAELDKLIEINKKYEELLTISPENEKGRKAVLDSIKKLEEEKTELQRQFAIERLELQLNFIAQEMMNLDENSIKY